ncbi:type II toxin-antitoxin system PemK/MazF family toxin [Promicromonospora sp. NPDC023987]|uniref:type II toxin-antitoxin system PemK/MazF family toxin n=1 Tax=Promicromonospora sp. NPDC023987 TaxID=3155360 RepID=UPI0033D2EB4F
MEYGLPIVAPISRTKLDYPTHVELDGVLPVACYIQCEQIRVVSAERLVRKVGGVDMIRVETIVRRLLAL